MTLLPLYIIFIFMMLGKVSFVFSLVALVVFTYFKFFKTNKKTPLDIQDFMKREPDVMRALSILHSANSYRTDINADVEKYLSAFFDSYFDLLFHWDNHKYELLLQAEIFLLKSINSLEFERDNIQYKDAFDAFSLVTSKYKTVLSKKYYFDLNAPLAYENKTYDMI